MLEKSSHTILMTADTIGGVWTYSMELSRGLAARGWQVVLATMGDLMSPIQRAEAASIPGLRALESSFRLEWMEQPWSDVDAASRWLLDLEEEFEPSVVHLNGFAHGNLPWRSPVLVVSHSCVMSWWRAVHGVDAPADWQEYRARVRAGLRKADLVVAPTHAMLTALHEHYGPLGMTRVIYNGIQLVRPSEQIAREEMIFAAGRLGDEAKNVAALGAVAPDLPWPVFVAGPACDAFGCTALPRNVHHCGRLSPTEVHQWMARAAIYCLPARYEPFGLSILEAACAGCALVLGDITSLRELWDGCARFIPPDRPSDIRRVLEELISNPAEREELGQLARQRATHFSREQFVEGYLNAYAELISNHHAKSIAA